MSEILSPRLDHELFEDGIDLELHRAFDMYGMLDTEAAISEYVQPTNQPINDLPATSIETEALSDTEYPSYPQDINWAALTRQDSVDNLPGDPSGTSFANEGVSGVSDPARFFDWGAVNMEQPGDLQDANWPTPPTPQGSEDLPAGSGEGSLVVDQATETLPGTPSVEDLLAENARLKALLGSQNASPTPAQTAKPPKTPPRKASLPKTPRSTPRKRSGPRGTSRSPIGKPDRPLKGAALAISLQKGPIESMWSAGTSPDERLAIQQRMVPPPPQYVPRCQQARKSPSANLASSVETGDPTAAHLDQMIALCNEPVQVSAVDFLTQPPQVAATPSPQPASYQDNSFAFADLENSQGDEELSPENALLLRELIEGAQYDQDIFSQSVQPMQAFDPITPSRAVQRTPDQMPQASHRQTFPQHPQGGLIEYGGYTYSPASNNGINAVAPPQFPTSSPAATPNTPTPAPKTKTQTTKRAPAKRAPAKSTPAATNKVTKATKKTHKRTTSTPSPAANGRQRSLQELYKAQFITLSKEEKARLLLPLLQGIDPVTGLQTGRPGTLGMASSLSAFNQGLTNGYVAAPAMDMGSDMNFGNHIGMGNDMNVGNHIGMGLGDGMNMNNDMGMGMGMGMSGGMNLGNNFAMPMGGGVFDMDNGGGMGTNAYNMAQEAAAELGNGYAMNRQSEALERAAMLQTMGKRR
ncbi:uncharacterized protein K460DRAFT_391240 [Cucurbitaria berberidis CBS 394.84]|uniref:Uncharacterized protein n=1 Tax=Cucurbitaria berberidis CBS 394.84 TaxID=1168544 RepID=A0A9P4GST3_9PLEO|nr:uncharacterized protein K460DRAFT_391240 [Cucurbitaria berberidis CBS 394.84]KAF1850831.1 hypothetical protein K460DRAFT_391240 [Cucurbitaria berberidis CBS 394.84]